MATKTTQPKTEQEVKAPISVIRKPRITEKAAKLGSMNTYTFDVVFGMTKNEIAKAFFAQYKHKPLKVHTVNVKPKTFWRKGVLGVARKSKKAYVTVAKGVKIDIM